MESAKQASSTPQPKRRRRWLIAAVLMFVVSAVSWWNWPRGDARFVGKWVGHDSRLVNPMILKSNGNGTILVRGQQLVFRWHVDGEWLVLGCALPKPIADVADQFSAATQRRFGLELITREYRQRIVELTEKKLRLNLDGVSETDTEYMRIPE